MRRNNHLSNALKAGALVAIVFLSVLTSACFTGSSPVQSAEAESAAVEEGSPGLRVTTSSTVHCPAPLRVGVLLDKSGSVRENVVPEMTEGELDDLIGLVDSCAGGEVAFGVLCNISGEKPFVRLYLPRQTLAALETAPARSQDPFTEMQRARVAAAATAQRRVAAERETAVRRTAIDHFRNEALALVQATVSCTRTDVVSGANRLLTYLAEPWPSSSAAVPTRVGVYVTDAQDNVRRQTLHHEPDLDAAHLLVGGSHDAGALAPLNPSRFESMGAALRWMQAAAAAR